MFHSTYQLLTGLEKKRIIFLKVLPLTTVQFKNKVMPLKLGQKIHSIGYIFRQNIIIKTTT